MASWDLSTAALASAAVVGAGAYLNARLSIGNDIAAIRGRDLWMKTFMRRLHQLGDTVTLYAMFDLVDETVDALWFEGKTWTYGQLKEDADRLADFLRSKGVEAGVHVGIFMNNSPELVIAILALSKLGAIAGLINSALRDETLAHCMNVALSTLVLSTPELSEFVETSLPHFSLNLGGYPDHLAVPKTAFITVDHQGFLPRRLGIIAAKRSRQDIAVLIFTSGTTGKPKACAIRNNQFLVVSNPLPEDLANPNRYFPLRQYSALPLFHGTGLFTGFSYCVGTSGTFCLSRKFSSSRFWKEVHLSRATRIIYVGELLRYLIASPPSPYDRTHNCIVANGNGLRKEVWTRFKERFGVDEIREFYRSTEGLAKFDNFGLGDWGKGKLQLSGPLRSYLEDDTFIVRFDVDSEEPFRDASTGFCVKTKPGEPGEVIGRVRDRSTYTEYLGNEAATDEKLLKDVFRKGDLFQRMGDLAVQDNDGWISFHDRIGDTFRWKGENVSAGEVRDHVSKLQNVHDVAVYGVQLSRYDGRAGAAAITLENRNKETEDAFIRNLYSSLKASGLPPYAIPRLVRIVPEMVTGFTFKQAKNVYQKRTWNPAAAENDDALYWLNGSQFMRIHNDHWLDIEAGQAKL